MRFPMPMPIPKPAEAGDGSTDLHYLSFTDAQRFAMTNEHQPSLAAAALRTAAAAKKKQVIARSGLASARVTSSLAANFKLLKNKSGFQIGITNRVRGVVSCNTCLKPRCIYSQSAISQMKPPLPPANPDNTAPDSAPPTATKEQCQKMAQDRLHDATESPIFMCGMSPLSPEDPCYDVFQCDPSLDCDTHIEANFYTSAIQRERLELCCHCAGVFDSPVMMHPSLKAPAGPYSVVLPVCKECLDGGCQIIARNARQNAESKKNKLDAEAARKAARLEKAAEAAAKEEEAQRQQKATDAGPSAGSGTGPAAPAQPKGRGKRATRFVHTLFHMFCMHCTACYY